jgi:polar amino acid transport system substrate-binding protein
LALASFAAFISGCGLFWEDPYVDVTVTPLNWIEIHYYNATREPIRRVNVRITGSGRVEVKSGTANAAIIDARLAGAMVSEGTDYENLTYTIGLNSEEYVVGFRKGSDLAAELNAFFAAAYADGSMQACAEKYGVQASLIPQ